MTHQDKINELTKLGDRISIVFDIGMIDADEIAIAYYRKKGILSLSKLSESNKTEIKSVLKKVNIPIPRPKKATR